jgi:hypothetical protein
MQLLALIWGILAVAGMLLAAIPCLGALNYLNIPFAIGGLIVAIVATTNAPPGAKGSGTAAIVLNVLAIVLGMLRLALGGFVI